MSDKTKVTMTAIVDVWDWGKLMSNQDPRPKKDNKDE